MKLKDGFELRTICNEKVLIACGLENIDFSHMVAMNESSAYLWEQVAGKDFDADTLADLLCQEYEVDRSTALLDANKLMDEWRTCGIATD